MQPWSLARELSGTIKEIQGTAQSMGCDVYGYHPHDIIDDINNGARSAQLVKKYKGKYFNKGSFENHTQKKVCALYHLFISLIDNFQKFIGWIEWINEKFLLQKIQSQETYVTNLNFHNQFFSGELWEVKAYCWYELELKLGKNLIIFQDFPIKT